MSNNPEIIEFQKKDGRIYESWGKEIEILNGDNDVSPKALHQKPDVTHDISKSNNIKRFYTFVKKRVFYG